MGLCVKYFDKLTEGTVVGLLHLPGEDTGGKLLKFKVIRDAVAAFALSGTWFIGTGAFRFVDFNLAFHLLFSLLWSITYSAPLSLLIAQPAVAEPGPLPLQ